jgi:hypothetical protein
VLAGKAESPRTEKDYLAWELFGNRAVRQGVLEAALAVQADGQGATGSCSTWRPTRPSARISPQSPDKVKAMVALWDDYARTNNVVLPSRGPFETLDDHMPQRVPDDAGFPPLVNKRQFVPPKDMLAEPKP